MQLLDLERKAYVDALSGGNFRILHAVTADGRVFVSSGQQGGRVMVYTPAREK